MKLPLVFLCLISAGAHAAQVGDTYQQVLAEKGAPKSQMQAGTKLILNYPDASIQFSENIVVNITRRSPSLATPPPSPRPTPSPTTQDPTAAKNEQLKAIARVKAIVNQPVAPIQRVSSMKVGTFPSWFHEGAITPDFANVDIRTTREASYDKWEAIRTQLNPDVYYASHDIEFNPMTKYFYADRSEPKKRLTEDEMIEINSLYRVIARCEKALGKTTEPAAEPSPVSAHPSR